MESVFLNAGLAAGVALATIPVILHMFMRQTPKKILFPAVRLIRERQKRSRKHLRIKNWLLLAARMLLIALMAVALARPRLWSKTTLGDNEVPTALALVFDTSLSMGYKERDKTRIDEAKERALEILKKSHAAGRVFVIDSAEPGTPAAVSPTVASKRVEALVLRAVNRPLNAAVGQAYKAVAGTELARHEVYVLTDLARTAWDVTRAAEGLDDAKNDKAGVSTFVLRLSPKALRDAAVVSAEPAVGFVAQDDVVPIRVKVRANGPPAKRVAEFWLDGKVRGKTPVDIPAAGESELSFETPKLSPGVHQGEIRLGGEPDPLDRDDVRYFTLDVMPAMKLLVVSDKAIDADFVANALDPETLRAGGAGRPFQVTRKLASRPDVLDGNLRDYACIFLLNVRTLPETGWGKLNQYVRDGGGLVVALGDRIDTEALTGPASQLLPATVGAVKRLREGDETATFGKADVAHPLFARNTKDLLADLAGVPIYAYRAVAPMQGTRTLLSYQNGDPALLERVFPGARTGRVLLWTTALSRRPGAKAEARDSWNDFPIVGWSFFAMMNDTVPYLANVAGAKLTYEAGDDVRLPLDPGKRFTNFAVLAPGARSPERLGDPATAGLLTIPVPPTIGPWTVTATGADAGVARTLGFSVNPPQSEGLLTPLTQPELESLFGGKDKVQLADDTATLNRVVKDQRVGRELFPLVMAIILLIVTLENVLANTFYREQPKTAAVPQRAAA